MPVKTYKFTDCNDRQVKTGDIIDIKQTVNGENLFVILDFETLDIRYARDLGRAYEYHKQDLFQVWEGETEYEIVGNLSDIMDELRDKLENKE